jgi:hypothetical protein
MNTPALCFWRLIVSVLSRVMTTPVYAGSLGVQTGGGGGAWLVGDGAAAVVDDGAAHPVTMTTVAMTRETSTTRARRIRAAMIWTVERARRPAPSIYVG